MNNLKKIIKKHKIVYSLFEKIYNFFIFLAASIAPIFTSKMKYKKIFKRPINLKSPKTLNEKMMYLKLNLYWNQQYIANLADKYSVHEFIKLKKVPEILNHLYGVWRNVDEIEWEKLPNKFVIKCNHGSGFNIICENKEQFDVEKAKKQLKKWMKKTYGYNTIEQGIYKKIEKKIIAEKFIETRDSLPPKDYKFFCSYGKVKFLFVASDRINNQTKFDYYYPDWTWIPVKNQHPNFGPISKPEMLNDMIKYAEILSSDIPLVRVDFYNENKEIIFGEMTMTHFGALNTFDPDEFDYIFGNLFPDINFLVSNYKGKIL